MQLSSVPALRPTYSAAWACLDSMAHAHLLSYRTHHWSTLCLPCRCLEPAFGLSISKLVLGPENSRDHHRIGSQWSEPCPFEAILPCWSSYISCHICELRSHKPKRQLVCGRAMLACCELCTCRGLRLAQTMFEQGAVFLPVV